MNQLFPLFFQHSFHSSSHQLTFGDKDLHIIKSISLSGQSNLSLSQITKTKKHRTKKSQTQTAPHTALSVFSDSAENIFLFQSSYYLGLSHEKENHRQ